jgi:hypothetical protein
VDDPGADLAAQLNTVAKGPNGSQIKFGVLEQLITLSGSSTTSTIQIPNRAIVFAVSELIVTAVTGAPSFGVGVSGNTMQFGGSLGRIKQYRGHRPDRFLFCDVDHHHGHERQLHRRHGPTLDPVHALQRADLPS